MPNADEIASRSPADRQQIASRSPADRQQKSDFLITTEGEIWACLVGSGDESNRLRLLELFEPLLGRYACRAALMLPDEEHAVLHSEACYAFLSLLDGFDVEIGVPFAGYIKAKLDLHVFNWCRSEQKRAWGENIWEDAAFDEKICATWMNRNTYLDSGVGEWLRGEVERLPERQKKVMQGIARGHSEREIGARSGITGVRVNQIKAAARKALIRKFEIFCEGS